MKFLKILGLTVLALIAGSITMGVHALPILAQNAYLSIEQSPSSLGTTPIADQYGVNTFVPVTNSISYGGGYINLSDADLDNRTYTMNPTNPDWWTGSGVIYTTNSNTLNVTFTNLMVTGFSFRIGANTNATGWIRAYYETDGGPESSLLTAPNFAISSTDSKTYGVYAKNTGNKCTVITKIVVEPPFTWGLGDFGITTGGGPCTEVTEPESISLLALGLLIMGLVTYNPRRRRLHPAKLTRA